MRWIQTAAGLAPAVSSFPRDIGYAEKIFKRLAVQMVVNIVEQDSRNTANSNGFVFTNRTVGATWASSKAAG